MGPPTPPSRNTAPNPTNCATKWGTPLLDSSMMYKLCYNRLSGCVSQSSLLMALLGELPLTEGSTVKMEGKVAYTSQEAWIFSSSIKQNILFGQPFHEERYKKVLKSTALADVRFFANILFNCPRIISPLCDQVLPVLLLSLHIVSDLYSHCIIIVF